MTDRIFYINGEFVDEQKANISAIDLAVLRGYGVFDSLRTYGGRPFRFVDHLVRLERSADLVGIELPWSRREISNAVETVLAASQYPETSIRILVTGGVSGNFFTPDGKPSLIIIGTELEPYPLKYYTNGVQVATARLERFMPAAKSTNYLAGQIAMKEAKTKYPDAFEVIYVNRAGNVTEAITSNVFAVIDGKLVTPGTEILLGITRQVVLEIVPPDIPVELRTMSLKEFYAAEEAFITGSKKEVLPIAAIDGKPMPRPIPGPQTQKIMERYRTYVEAFIQESLEI